MDKEQILEFVHAFQNKAFSEEKLVENIMSLWMEDLEFAKIDHHRSKRHGFPEIVYGEGKTLSQIHIIIEKILARSGKILVTRINEADGRALGISFPVLDYDPRSKTLIAKSSMDVIQKEHPVLILTAGTVDETVALEAKRTLTALGVGTRLVMDVGVAGLHRLLGQMSVIKEAEFIIVIAGMDAALPSVVAGLVSKPVVAVPTSVGYGTGFGGFAALLAALNSCAAGVTVVNIDNGFGAAFAAWRMLQSIDK